MSPRICRRSSQFLIREGHVDYAMLRREAVSKNDLMAAVRESGCLRPSRLGNRSDRRLATRLIAIGHQDERTFRREPLRNAGAES